MSGSGCFIWLCVRKSLMGVPIFLSWLIKKKKLDCYWLGSNEWFAFSIHQNKFDKFQVLQNFEVVKCMLKLLIKLKLFSFKIRIIAPPPPLWNGHVFHKRTFFSLGIFFFFLSFCLQSKQSGTAVNLSDRSVSIPISNIWAMTWQNQQNECAPSKDSDQPGHPPSLIRIFAVRIKKAQALSYPLSAQRRLWSD